jgi:hypothetical protein
MTSLITEPQLITTAAADAAEIGSTISAAKAAAAGPTTSLVPAAEDEVSALTASLFGAYGRDCQALLQQATVFHDQFAAALAAAGKAYAGAEAAASSTLGSLEANVQGLQGGTAVASTLAGADPALPAITTPVIGLFMGGSGLPIPSATYLAGVLNWVNFSGVPSLPLNQVQALFTPEGLYPLTGVKTLPLNTSVSQGVTILQDAINQQLFPTNPNVTPQGSVAVLGYSQSAIISSVVMQNILNGTYPFTVPTPSQLNFTLIGDIMNPNGGIFERFVGLQLPSLGLDFLGSTPPNTQYGTSIYTLEYDGFADFPQYPINFLADLNAFAGIYFVHGTYPAINPASLPVGDKLIELPGSASLPGGTGATNYYMITQPNLPLLDPIRDIPVIGTPIADLLQPDLTYLVNWGYGNPMFGWSQGPANVPTPFGVIPPLSDTLALAGDLVTGTHAGINAFVPAMNAAVAGLPTALSTTASSGAANLLSAVSSPASIISTLQSVNTRIANTISSAASQAYAVLLPTADIGTALLISVPSYDVNLFLSGIGQVLSGQVADGLVYAFGAPIAADTALLTLAGGFELEVIGNAVGAIV